VPSESSVVNNPNRMFTSRFTWSLDDNPLSVALRARRESGETVIDLTAANPGKVGLAWDADKLAALYAHPGAVRYDPDPRGMRSAREAVATYYTGHGATVSPDSIHLSASTSEGYGWLLKLLTDPGDEILAPAPSYPLLEFLGAMECATVKTYPLVLRDGVWRVDEAALDAAVTPRSRAILVVNPNNPTGSRIDDADRIALRRVALRHGLALVVDEVFLDFPAADGVRPGTFADEADAPTFVLSGFSKIAALPQAKLGWIVTTGPAEFAEKAIHRLDYIADTYLSVNTAVQLAAPDLFAEAAPLREKIRARCDANDAALRAWCSDSGHGVVCEPREAGWYAVLRLPRGVGEELATLDLLRREGVYVHPGHFFGYDSDEARWVISLLSPADELRLALPAFDAVLRRQ
jgi:alanine-synthesizing transaminase